MKKKKQTIAIQYACLILIAVAFLIPCLWLVMASLDFSAGPMIKFPEEPTIENYINVFKNPDNIRGFLNSFLLAGGTKGKRYCLPNSTVLIHQPIGGTGRAQASDIDIAAKQILKTREKMNRMLSEMTGQPYEKICLDTDRDNYMTAQEALEYGLVDKIIEKH